MNKRIIAVLTALLTVLCSVPAAAAVPGSHGVIARAASTVVEKIPVPDSAQILSAYYHQDPDSKGKFSEITIRYRDKTDLQNLWSAIGSLQAGSTILNIPNIPKADAILELRTGDSNLIRYHLYAKAYGHEDRVISQKVVSGQAYQGTSFRGGNVSAVIKKLMTFADTENKGQYIGSPFFMEKGEVEGIYLFLYRDQTFTKILYGPSVDYILNLLHVCLGSPFDSRPVLSGSKDPGNALTDLNDMVLILNDGTRVSCTLYENGVRMERSDNNLNVLESRTYAATPSYQQLLDYLRGNQSYTAPAWLGSMNPDRITQISMVSPDGTRLKTYHREDKELQEVIDELIDTQVVPLSFVRESDLTGLSNAYRISVTFNSGVTYTIDYGADRIEIKSSDIHNYAATYRLPKGRDNKTLDRLMRADESGSDKSAGADTASKTNPD